MRVLIITQWFDPEPVPKGLSFAKAIAAKGHEVEVITGFPNYPGGQLYPGFRIKLLQREVMDGVLVNRVALYPSHDHGALRRLVNYVSFGVSSALCGLFAAKKPDVIYCYHPPLTSGLSAAVVALFRRAPLVYDIQDLWPDTLAATGMVNNRVVLRLVGMVCRAVYCAARELVVLSPGFKSRLVEIGVPEKKVSVIYNWCDEGKILGRIVGPVPDEMEGGFNVVFAGTMGRAQALTPVLDAAALVADKDSRIRFLFVGGGLEVGRLQDLARRRGQTNVVFLPARPMNEIGSVLSAASCLLVHLRDDPLFSITIPSKTQAYMAIGRPVLMAVRGDAADVVRSAAAGVVAVPEDAESIATAVLKLAKMSPEELDAMGENGRRHYQQSMCMEKGVSEFVDVFKRVAAK